MGTHGNARAMLSGRSTATTSSAPTRPPAKMGQISLEEALELLALMGRFGDKRFDRAAVQGLQRLLDEQALSLVDVQIAAANIAALATATRASAVGARRRFVRHGATRQVPAREDRVCARPVAEKKRLPLAPTSTAAGVARHLRLSPGCRSGAEPVWFLGGAVRPAPRRLQEVFRCVSLCDDILLVAEVG